MDYAVRNELYIVSKRDVKIVAQKDTSDALKASSRGGSIITPHLLESQVQHEASKLLLEL